MIRKAVLPVAGFGTRCLPASKAIPKEMITIVDRPVIQYVVEEAIAAGIREIVLVTSSNKSAIENHFDTHAELEASLEVHQMNMNGHFIGMWVNFVISACVIALVIGAMNRVQFFLFSLPPYQHS